MSVEQQPVPSPEIENLLAETRVFPPDHFAFSASATAFIPSWFPPLSPIRTIRRKPWVRRQAHISASRVR